MDEEREDELLDGDEIAEDQIDDQPEEPIAEEAGAEEFPDLPPLPSGPREPERFIVEPALSVVQATEVAEPEDGVANVVPIPGSKLEGSADAIRLDYDPSVASCASKSGVAASVANERKRASEDDPQSSSAHRSKTLKTEMGRSGGASDLVLLRTPDFGVAEDGGSVFKEFPSFHSYTARSHSARSTPRRRFGVDEGTAEEDIEKGVVRVASEDARINQMQHSYTKHSSPRPLGSPLSLSARRTASPDHVGYTKPRSTPQKLHRFAKGSQAETGEDDDADANSFNAVSGTPGSKLRHEVRSDATIDEVA